MNREPKEAMCVIAPVVLLVTEFVFISIRAVNPFLVAHPACWSLGCTWSPWHAVM